MSFRQRVEYFVSHPPLAIPAAVVLALLPGPHWLGVLLATLVLLRAGGLLSYLGYGVVLAATYVSAQGYAFTGVAETLVPFLLQFAPIGIMAFALRYTAQLGFSLELGAYIIAAAIGLGYLFAGPPSLEAAVAFFDCRRAAVGFSEADALAALYGINVKQAAFILMLFWPFLYFIFQASILLLARYLQAVLFYKGGFSKDFHKIRLSKASGVFFGLAFLIEIFSLKGTEMLLKAPEYVIISQLSAVALGLLVIAGLAVVHWYVGYKRIGIWFLVLFYTALMLLGAIILPGLAILALADAGLNLRRLKKAPSL